MHDIPDGNDPENGRSRELISKSITMKLQPAARWNSECVLIHLLRQADKVMMYKYVAKNVAIQNGFTVTFMPKPLFQDNGSGMHVQPELVERRYQQIL